MENLTFFNHGVLSLMDLTTMGCSSKRNDDTKNGKYDSGLKYAIAILLRNGTPPIIRSGKYQYEFKNRIITDDDTGKQKEIIVILKRDWTLDVSEWEEIETAFAVNLGYDWSFWMAIRELYSNCMDENGNVVTGSAPIDYYDNLESTVILVPGCEKVQEILDNWKQYFTEDIPIYENGRIKIYENNLPNKPYTIYKNGVMVYSDSRRTSMYVYDHSTAGIDEMRVLRDRSSTEIAISYAILECTDSDFVLKFINDFAENNNVQEEHLVGYGRCSNDWVNQVNYLYEQGELKTLPQELYEVMLSDSRFKLGKKSLASAIYGYSPKIDLEIVTTNSPSDKIIEQGDQLELIPLELTFNERVIKICKSQNVEVIYPIVESIIKNYCKVISDMSEKVLHVDSEFSEDNVWEIVKEQFRMQSNDKSDRDLIYKEYLKLLNK